MVRIGCFTNNVYNPFPRVIDLIDGHTGVVPPGPFSNPEVKRALVDRGTGIFLGAAPTLSIIIFFTKEVVRIASGGLRTIPPSLSFPRGETALCKNVDEKLGYRRWPYTDQPMDDGA